MKKTSQADRVREHARATYLAPARRRGDSTIEIVTGDVVKDLRLINRTPLVCQALKSNKFLDSNNLTIEKIEGPPSGLGNTVKLTYKLGSTHQPEPRGTESPFLRARGIAKEVFASLGGGEAFIRAERAAWGDRRES